MTVVALSATAGDKGAARFLMRLVAGGKAVAPLIMVGTGRRWQIFLVVVASGQAGVIGVTGGTEIIGIDLAGVASRAVVLVVGVGEGLALEVDTGVVTGAHRTDHIDIGCQRRITVRIVAGGAGLGDVGDNPLGIDASCRATNAVAGSGTTGGGRNEVGGITRVVIDMVGDGGQVARSTELVPRRVAGRIVGGAVVTAVRGVLLARSGHDAFNVTGRGAGMAGDAVIVAHGSVPLRYRFDAIDAVAGVATSRHRRK